MIQIENIEANDESLKIYLDYQMSKAKIAGLKAAIKTLQLELDEERANMPKLPKLVSDTTSVEILEFSKREKTRLNTIFKSHNIKTIGDLVSWTRYELLEIRTVGPKTIREIVSELENIGYKLAE